MVLGANDPARALSAFAITFNEITPNRGERERESGTRRFPAENVL